MPEERPRRSRSKTIGALDGLRALAVAAVVAFHYNALSGGFLGVDLFFVLSGFLITRVLLVRRTETGSLGLRHFWIRRVRRLFPAVAVVLLTVVIWVHFLGAASIARITSQQTLFAFLGVSNWYNLVVHLGYWDVGLNRTPLNHLWSLAVEEQFYAVWPLLAFAFLGRRFLRRSLAVVALVLAVIAYGLMPFVFQQFGLDAAYLGTETRAGALLLGCALALGLWTITGAKPGPLARRWMAPADLGALACAAALGYFWITASLSGSLFSGVLAVCGVLAAGLIGLVTINPTGIIARALSLPLLTHVGRRSYALYLWHFPVLVLVTEQWTGWSGLDLIVARIVITALATELSYLAIEGPLRRSKIRPIPLLAGCLVVALATIGFSTVEPVVPRAPSAKAAARETPVPVEAANLRLLVVGDSWAERTQNGLQQMNAPRPAAVYAEGLGNCGIADPAQAYSNRDNSPFQPPTACETKYDRWRDIIETKKPDATLMVLGNIDQASMRLTKNGPIVSTCDDPFKERYAKQLDSALALLTSRGAPVFVTNVIDGANDFRPRSDCMNALLEDAVTRNAAEGVHLLDLRSLLCRSGVCSSSIDGLRVYDETGHLDPLFQARVCEWELNAIMGAGVKPAAG